jgi:glutamine cyclotransferase
MNWKQKLQILLLTFGSLSLSACRAERLYEVLETKDHDSTLYTQGLIVDGDNLIESGGLYGESRLVRYKADTGEIINSTPLPNTIFAEGIHQLGDSIFLLTWQENIVYRLDASSFVIRQTFPVETEGWGLTHNGEHFIQSDGSDNLYFRNSSTFKVEKTLPVRNGAQPVRDLNELEFAKGLIWANVYTTPTIVAISPDSGQVVFKLDLSELTVQHNNNAAGYVLNGIAYDSKRDAFWITGKCWDKRYLIHINTTANKRY